MLRSLSLCAFLVTSDAALASGLAGRIVEDHTGNPLASAEIRVVKPGMRALAADLETSSDGHFVVATLPDGEYRLEVSKPNFIGTSLHIANLVQSVEIRLVRAGVITGTVVDAKGQPVRGAVIYALPKPAGGGPLRMALNNGGVRLNERGQYRLHGLAPGEYAVAVTYGASTAIFGSTGGADVRPDLGSGAMLYPDNARPRFFTVSGGEEYRNIDFSIIPTELHSVSGRIELPAPKTDFWLALFPADRANLASAVTKTGPDGTFRFEGVAAGVYALTVAGPMRGYGGKGITGDAPFYGRTSISVAADLDGVTVPLAKGLEAPFILKTSGGCPTSARIDVIAVEDFAVRIDRSGTIGAGKETSIGNLAPALYQITAGDLGDGCYQSSETQLDLSHGVSKEPVTVQVAAAGSLRGKLAGAVRTTSYLIALTPADAVNGTVPLQAVFADADGRFAFGGLRPGRYRVGIQPATGGAKARWLSSAAGMIEIEISGGSPTEIELPAPVRQE